MSQKYSFLHKVPKSDNSSEKLDENFYQHKPNIVKAAASVLKKLRQCTEVVTVAQMQSGKTDVMKRLVYVIHNYNAKIENVLGLNIDKNHIYLIICASSINLKNQLKLKLPEIKNKIYHLNDINTFLKNIFEYESLFLGMVSNGLVIFDECHCDAEQKTLIDTFRNKLDFYAKEFKTTYYKVGFSASPYEQIFANYTKVVMDPGENYYGLKDMFATINPSKNLIPIIFQAKSLENNKECSDLFTEIAICNYYYIFRLPGKKLAEDIFISNVENHFKLYNSKLDTYIYDMNFTSNINDLLKNKPLKPTVIYLKDKLRMGEYLDTSYVYMVHDDPCNTYTHTTIQSLLGRCCGYNKKSHQTIIYCDYEKAWQHYKWISHNYDINYIPTDAKYIKKSGILKESCIFNLSN